MKADHLRRGIGASTRLSVLETEAFDDLNDLLSASLEFSHTYTELMNCQKKINSRLSEPAVLALDTSVMNQLKEILVENLNAYDLQGKCLHERSSKLLDILRLTEKSQAMGLEIASFAKLQQTNELEQPYIEKQPQPKMKIFNGQLKQAMLTTKKEHLSAVTNRVQEHTKPHKRTEIDHFLPMHTPQRMSIPIATQIIDQLQTPLTNTIYKNEGYTQTQPNKPSVTEVSQVCVSVRCASVQASLVEESIEEIEQQQSFYRTHTTSIYKQNNSHSSNHNAKQAPAKVEPTERRRHLNFASGTLINIHEVLRARKESRSQDSEKMKKIDEFKRHIETEVEQINRELRIVKAAHLRQPQGDCEDREIEQLEEQIRRLSSQQKVPTLKFDLSTKVRQTIDPNTKSRKVISKSPGRVSSFIAEEHYTPVRKVQIKMVKGASKRHYWERDGDQERSYRQLSKRLVTEETIEKQSVENVKKTISLASQSRKPLLSSRMTQIAKRR